MAKKKKKKLQRVAILVDYDNFRSQCRNRRIEVDWQKLKDRVGEYGHVVLAAAYTDVRQLPDDVGEKDEREDIKMMRAGFLLVHCSKLRTANTTYRKDMVDNFIANLMSLIAFLEPEIDIVVIASVDRDFIVPINALKDAKKTVYVLTPTRFENPELRRVAGNRIIYHKEAEVAHDERRKVIEAISDGDFSLEGEPAARAYLESLFLLIALMRHKLGVNNDNYSFRRLQDELVVAVGNRIDLGRSPAEAVKQRLELLSEADVLITENRDERFIRYVLDLGHDLVRYVHDATVRVTLEEAPSSGAAA